MTKQFETELTRALAGIAPLDGRAMGEAKRRWDSIAHPLGSLGLLETDIIRIAGITGSADVDLGKKAVIAMCADNGVVAEGVTQTGQEVTAIVTENMSRGDTSVCRMAKVAGAQVIPVDIGVARPVVGEKIRQCCVRRGTANMTKGPAMAREEAAQAVLTGVELVGQLKGQGVGLLATGEMGIGNTTTSSAIVSVLLGRSPAQVTGRGAGLSSEGLARKIKAIETAIAVNQPDPADGLDVLSKVGGLDIAGLAGVFLGGAVHRVPVLVDGFISSAASVSAREKPVSMACSAALRGMAGPRVMFQVPPSITTWDSRPSTGPWPAMPTSTGNTWAPAVRAMRHTEEVPAPMARATARVTSWPVWVTPSSTTPLSAQKTATPFRANSSSGVPAAPAACTTSSSSRPRPWRGLAMASHRPLASSMAL